MPFFASTSHTQSDASSCASSQARQAARSGTVRRSCAAAGMDPMLRTDPATYRVGISIIPSAVIAIPPSAAISIAPSAVIGPMSPKAEGAAEAASA